MGRGSWCWPRTRPSKTLILKLSLNASCFTSHVSRFTSHVSRLTSHVSRLTSHVSSLTFQLSPSCLHATFANNGFDSPFFLHPYLRKRIDGTKDGELMNNGGICVKALICWTNHIAGKGRLCSISIGKIKPFLDATAISGGLRVLGMVGLATLICANEANASLITQTDGSGGVDVQYDTTPVVNDFNLYISLYNNDPGTEYESGIVRFLNSAVDSLYNTPRNLGIYSSKEDFIEGENIHIYLIPGGENIDLGWSATPNSDFSEIILTHNPGIPNLTYEQWLEGYTPLTLCLTGNLDALKAGNDALPWNQATDNHFVFNGSMANAFTATTTTGFHPSTSGQTGIKLK